MRTVIAVLVLGAIAAPVLANHPITQADIDRESFSGWCVVGEDVVETSQRFPLTDPQPIAAGTEIVDGGSNTFKPGESRPVVGYAEADTVVAVGEFFIDFNCDVYIAPEGWLDMYFVGVLEKYPYGTGEY